MALYFVEISGSSARLSSEAFQQIKKALQDLGKKDDYQIYHCYRTVGENKLVLLIKGDVDIVVDSIHTALDGNISVTCTLLRSYEGFLRNLGGDEKVCADISPLFTSPTKTLLYNTVDMDHQGKSTDDFHKIWLQHAEMSFAARAKGVVEFRAFKVAGRREARIFLNLESADIFDDMVPKYPLVQGLGDGFNSNLKALKPVM